MSLFCPCKNSAPYCDPPYLWDHDLNKPESTLPEYTSIDFLRFPKKNYKEFSIHSKVSNSTRIMTHPTLKFHNLTI